MRYALLYGAELSDLSEFHREVAKKLEFPVWYGCNPDALYDCLTDIIRDTTLVFFDAELFAAKTGPKGRTLLRVLADAAEQNRYFYYRPL